jgi:hypothetical protein
MGRDQYLLGRQRAEEERLARQSPEYEGEARWLLDRLEIKAGPRAIDLGCGPQGVLKLLAGRVGLTGTVVGVESAIAPPFGSGLCGSARHDQRTDFARRHQSNGTAKKPVRRGAKGVTRQSPNARLAAA